MIGGGEALKILQDARAGARREEDRLVAALDSATEEAARLRAAEVESYRALARVRLDALARDEVTGTLDSAERSALALLETRRATMAETARRRQGLVDAVAAAREAHGRAVAAVERALEAIDDLRERTQARLESDDAWVARRRALTQAKEVAAAAGEKAGRAEGERAEKARPYEADALFVYLWRRGYGTPAYAASPLVRYVDGRVAALIGYEEARANYFMLTEIPVRLREHADRLAEDVAGAAEALAQVERAALEADGVRPLEAALAEAEGEAEAAETALAAEEGALARIDAEEEAARVGGVDPMLREALDLLAGSLAREDLRDLRREALATPTREDERIVARLGELRDAIARTEREIADTRKAVLDAARRRQELDRSSDSFRRKGYDDPFGGFVNERVIGQVIAGILGGILSSRDLEKVLRDGFQRRPPRTSGTFGGGITLPGGGPWGRGRRMGGAWGGGGFRTGGSMGRGGGFKTGGSF